MSPLMLPQCQKENNKGVQHCQEDVCVCVCGGGGGGGGGGGRGDPPVYDARTISTRVTVCRVLSRSVCEPVRREQVRTGL